MADSRQVEMLLLDLQNEIERVRGLYDQYFSGVLKHEPRKEHESLHKILKSIRPGDLKTTAARFKYQNLQQRYTLHSTHWSKVLKQMEEGTFRRDLAYLHRVKDALKDEIPLEKAAAVDARALTTTREPGQRADAGLSSKLKGKAYSPSLERLYAKISSLSSESGSKAPNKEKFLDSISKQIKTHKAKNPDKKVDVKVARNKDGKIEIKISAH